MRIRVITNPITTYGSFAVGDILNDQNYPCEFLHHLVDDCGAAEYLEYETKVDMEYEPVKKPRSLQSSEQGKASEPKISKLQRKRKLSQSTTRGN